MFTCTVYRTYPNCYIVERMIDCFIKAIFYVVYMCISLKKSYSRRKKDQERLQTSCAKKEGWRSSGNVNRDKNHLQDWIMVVEYRGAWSSKGKGRSEGKEKPEISEDQEEVEEQTKVWKSR